MATVKLFDGRCFDDREVRFEDCEPWFLEDGICYGGRCAVVVIECDEGGEEEHDVRTEHADPWCVWVEYERELDPNSERLEFKRQRSLELVNDLQSRYIKSIVDMEPMKEILWKQWFRDKALKDHRRAFRSAARMNPETGRWE